MKTGFANNADDQHAVLSMPAGTAGETEAVRRTEHPDSQWFAHAKLGLFLHWGLSSVHGGVDLSWGMIKGTRYDKHLGGRNKLDSSDYFALANRFDPRNYDPEKWVSEASRSGFKYAVLTTKHHEGYALWPSAYGDFNTATHGQGQDYVKPFVDACRNNGLKVGLYYSPPDWHYNRDYMSFQYRIPEKPKPEGWEEQFHAYLRGQIEELLTQYGKIDLLFFDGGPPAITIERIRELQPGIVVNPRMHGTGDYLTPECKLPESKPEGWWELCENWTDSWGSWGYMKEEKYRSTGYILGRLAKVLTWDGNYLLNMAPNANGELPEIAYMRLKELKAWMDLCGEAVFGTVGGPHPGQSSVPVTRRGDAWYFFLLPHHEGFIRVQGVGQPKQIQLLWVEQEAASSYVDGQLMIEVADTFRTELVDIVKVQF